MRKQALLSKLATAAAVLMAAMAPTVSSAATPGPTMSEAVRMLNSNDTQMTASLNKLFGSPLPADKLEVAKFYAKRTLSEPALVAKLDELSAGLNGAELSGEQKNEAIFEAIAQLRAKGLSRLTSDQLTALATYTRGFLSALPTEYCNRVANGELSTYQSYLLESRYLATTPLATFREVHSIANAATLAELHDYPRAQSLTAVQAKAADAAFEVSFDKVAAAFSKKNISKEEPSPCLVGAVSIDATLAMKEPYRTWSLLKMFQPR